MSNAEPIFEGISDSFSFIAPPNGVLVETARLHCRQPLDYDLELMNQLFTDPIMTRFFGGPTNEETTYLWLKQWQDAWIKGEAFCGIMAKKDTGEAIGSASIHPSTIPNMPGAEISYMVLPEFQRQGFAFEMAQGLVEHVFNVFEMSHVLIGASPENTISNEIARKLGFKFLGEQHFVHVAWPLHTRHAIWRLDNTKLAS